jgi:hypothetical protein
MAKKNKKKRQAGFMFPPPLAVVLILIVGSGVFYVGLKSKAEALGRDIKALEVKREALRERLVKEQCEWAQMLSPSRIELALKQHGLVMTYPNRDQIVRLRGDGSIEGLAAAGRQRPAAPRDVHSDRVVLND